MTSPNLSNVPAFALNFDGLGDLAARTRAEWESDWVSQIGDTVSSFLNFQNGIDSLFAAADMAEETKEAILAIFEGIVGNFFESLLDNVPLLRQLKQLLEILSGAVVQPVDNVMEQILAWWNSLGIAGINNIIETLTGIIGGTLEDLAEWAGSILNPIIETLTGIVGGTLEDLADWAGAILKPIIETLTGIIGGTLEDLADWAGNILGPIIETITGIVGGTLEDLADWAASIPIIGPLVETISGIVGGTLEDLGQWFDENVLKGNSPLNAANLFGQIRDTVLGIIPVSHVSDSQPNLLEAGGFDTSGLVAELDGWSWDSTLKAVKVVCNGNDMRLFNKTPIPLAKQNSLYFGAKVKTSGLTGTNARVALNVIPYRGTAMGDPVEVAFRAGSAADWASFSGTWTAPDDGVSSVVLRISVENATAGTVWFDELDCHKTGMLGQQLVDSLETTWETVWNGAFGSGGTGKKWFDMGGAIGGVSSTANTANTNAGTANTNLGFTWNSLWDAFNGTTGSSGKTYTDAADKAGAVRSSANTAGTNANTANTNLGFTWNSLWDAFNGTTGSSGKTYTDAADKAGAVRSSANTADTNANTANTNLQSTWNQFFDAFNGTSGSTARTLTQSATAAGGVRSTANTASANANTAITNASTAQTTANTASTNAGTANTNLQSTWNQFFDAFNNTTGSTGKTLVQSADAAKTVRSTATTANANASTAITNASTANNRAVAINNRLFNANDATTNSVIQVAAIPTADIANAIGTTPVVGSGARISRTNTATKINLGAVAPGNLTQCSRLSSTFFVDANNAIKIDRASSDITCAASGRFTVTYAGWYLVELGLATNSSPGSSGAFAVSPVIILGGPGAPADGFNATTGVSYPLPNKIGACAFGSYGAGLGGYSRAAHASFIIYLDANQWVDAGVKNYIGDALSNFYQGDAQGANTYFSISLLNRTQEG